MEKLISILVWIDMKLHKDRHRRVLDSLWEDWEKVRNSRCNDYHKVSQDLTKVKQDSNRSEIPTGSTAKNDLGVREFEEIVVEYPPEDLCTYPEYKGKPYLSIKYKEGNDCFVGYGTYNPKVFSRYLRDYFMPLVTPQEPIRPKGHWREVDTNMYACSKCSHVLTIDPLDNSILGMNTCPFCSAEMEGVVDDKGRSKTLVRNRTENVGR